MVGEIIKFTGSATGGIIPYTYTWDLDNDGEYDDAVGPTTFESWGAAGIYIVCLKVVDDNANNDTDIAQVIVERTNDPPNKPNTPNGRSSGKVRTSYQYSTNTTDSNGDDVFYLFDWGDGTISGWLGPYISGDTVNAFHTWTQLGSYSVNVKAMDSNLAESEWSNSLPITMSKNKQITNNDNNPPNPPEITGPLFGKVGEVYFYYFTVTDPDEDDGLWELEIDFGDEIIIERSCDSGECVPWKNGETVEIKHMWKRTGTYELTARVMDVYGELSEWSDPLSISMPKNKPYINTPFIRFLENHPHLFSILRHLLEI